ncbi:MAG: hypothetical protein WBY94_18010 [Polyangiaceae bacterium]
MTVSRSARRFASARLVRALLVPLIVALPSLFWVVTATRRASLTTLGRDQGIFQYVAWALQQGAVDYRDVRDVNGPLTHLVHLAFLAFGGADEHRFRVLDLAVTGASYALLGFLAPGLLASRKPGLLDRIGWAFAGWVVLSGQYLLYGYWDIAQRESFFDWFMLPSVAIQIAAHGAATRPSRERLLVLAGALSVIPWFGKPTYSVFTLAQIAVLLWDPDLAAGRNRALAAFSFGGAFGAATQVAFVASYGDLVAFARIQLVDVPAMYRFIWPRAVTEIFSEAWRSTQAVFALFGAVVLVGLVCLGEMPRRAVLLALVPICALASVVAQAKGFPYHFHPVTSGVHLQWLVFVAWTAERTRVARRRWAIVRLVPVALGASLALRIATAVLDSPHVRASWMLWEASSRQQRQSPEYFAHFPETDFFPYELRQAADYIGRHTAPSDRVQSYGMDPYVLFLAHRLSATPYIYAYDLNADAALAGGTGGRPNPAQAERIRSIREGNEIDMLRRLEKGPPAAFVFIDGSPLLSSADAWDDFEDHCARVAAWVTPRYRESARFGHFSVWLRLDRTPDGDAPAEDKAEPVGPVPPPNDTP